MIKITAKKGKLNAEMKGSAFEILDEAIEITKAFYTSFNKHLPNFGDFYLHRINTDLKKRGKRRTDRLRERAHGNNRRHEEGHG